MKWCNKIGQWPWRRHYLLMDGMHSCAYIPRHTYRMLHGMMRRELRRDAMAENSLRFLWSRASDGSYVLTVNPQGVEMLRTHGLATDSGGRVLVACPYVQQVYHAYGKEPEWCGRMYLRRRGQAGGRWLAQFEIALN